MLSIKILKVCVFIGFIAISYSQEQSNSKIYQSYITDSIPKHLLIIDDKKVIIKIFGKGLFPSTSNEFITRTQNDTIFLLNELVKNKKTEGLIMSNYFTNQFTKQFRNGKIYKKSNKELIFLNKNAPYFKKELVDSIIGNNTIYYINGKLFKSSLNSSENQIDLNKVLKKPKRAKLKILDGKQAYEKYGIIGLYGIIEITDRKRCYK